MALVALLQTNGKIIGSLKASYTKLCKVPAKLPIRVAASHLTFVPPKNSGRLISLRKCPGTKLSAISGDLRYSKL